MWIRGQDRTILKEIVTVSIGKYTNVDEFFIRGWGKNGLHADLGDYKTKERALEILDEIQEKLTGTKIDSASVEYIVLKSIVPTVYEMPKK